MAATFLNHFYFWCFMAHGMMAGSGEKENDPRGKHEIKTKNQFDLSSFGYRRLITRKSATRPMVLSTINQVTHFSILEPLRDQILNWFLFLLGCCLSLLIFHRWVFRRCSSHYVCVVVVVGGEIVDALLLSYTLQPYIVLSIASQSSDRTYNNNKRLGSDEILKY